MKIVQVIEPVPVDPDVVTVTLTQSEVNTLIIIFGNIGGDNNHSPRGITSKMLDILSPYTDFSIDRSYYRTDGSIFFTAIK
jgi:hypothetical protein